MEKSKQPKIKPAKTPKSHRKAKSPVAKTKEAEPDFKLSSPAEDQSLVLEYSRHLFGKIILGIILFCLTFFFARTAFWELSYYSEKEGSERAAVESVAETTPAREVDETEVTEAQRTAHTVAADEPRYLSIEKLGIRNARIISVGVNSAGELDTPYSIFDVGWYNRSSKPGTNGVLVMDAHNGGPNVEGVFKHLNQLYADDLIVIERGDGAKFTYKVVENKEVPLAEADAYMATAFSSPVPGTEALTLISCIGDWSQVQQTYLSRQFVRAVRVQE